MLTQMASSGYTTVSPAITPPATASENPPKPASANWPQNDPPRQTNQPKEKIMKLPANYETWTNKTLLSIFGRREGCGSIFSETKTLGEILRESSGIADRGDFEWPDTLIGQLYFWADGRFRDVEIEEAE
jgi:hypothetical protein